ncbi:aldehyde dehydrogenase family protein [Jiangella sp. DSM 45060]|uniref:aldehyde dehydrogenase family protein n=1 Tax=Jiangella sp. DSM 45060 TaxID=1798224 RepID=UPI00087C5CEC|nr:aldehyde dehydrogenase family protein [Jiangella sp. DSM 45060]SDT16583.1 aldehyde dehydrogenase (NAD+) [Jiangella sp. DSM 45060]
MERFESYVGGRWMAAREHRENVNPSDTSDIVGLFAAGDRDDVDAAVTAARMAQPDWAAASPQTRADLLESVAARILTDVDRLAELLAREEGKTRGEAEAEVRRAAQIFRFFAGEAVRLAGETQDSIRPGVTVTHRREPVGVVGVITPWNFPIAIPSWKTAPALAYGNTVVLKPAELVPASVIELARIIDDAGFPPGVFNVVTGSGGVVGDAIVTHPGVDAVTFTGSEPVGRGIAVAAAGRFAKVQLELGGKNPLVIAADADLDVAVDCAVNGAFFSTGQRCTASSRLIVDDAVYGPFVERLRARMAALRVGHALAPGTEIGPVVDGRQLDTDLRYLDLARTTPGASVHGGDLVERDTKGHYLAPALIEGLDNDAVVNREEIFGPVAGVIRVSGHDEAVAVANDTEFGLVAGICTTSLALADDFQRRSRTGMVMVNLPTAGVDPHVAFGGRRRSSYGPKEQGAHARDFFTEYKIAYVRP